MIFTTVELLSILLAFLFLFFAGYLLAIKSNKRLSNLLFAAHFIITALDISAYFYPKFITLPYSAEMLRIKILAGMKAPIIYLYILSVLYDDFKLKAKHILYFSPLFINLIILIPNFFSVNASKQELYFLNFFDQPETIFATFFSYIVVYAFILAELYQVGRYRKIVKQNYSNPKALVNYTWLKQFLIISIILTTITFIKGIYRLAYDEYETTNELIITMLLFGIAFGTWLFSKALFAPNIFQGINTRLEPIEEISHSNDDISIEATKQFTVEKQANPFISESDTNDKEKFCATTTIQCIQEKTTDTSKKSKDSDANPTLTEDDVDDIRIKSIQQYMQEKEPYLDSSLTVQKLGIQLKIPPKELSSLINQHIGTHFFDFINQYRVKKAMEILKETSASKRTIQEVMYDVGFNSKNSFNTAFKKYTNLTPTQYRKRH
ncbi:helix-turn-helix domain-containing protein [Aureibacter tunicatorum]|uniref:AraC-like DNA-binding protein n=1 Tax=Aureibacter tunicatorum TaxID=866807 RepID=A0AAE3XQB5_9BACT|nr:helix-turn-helix domain-containing protein [Aureibacter tunicatorum]MDR6241172.1 AraC-like DNA-binding protein [Aureibacter tunicatorum]BDD03947.1 hypothetical protein AUTU_14300 [Aureibacter tunicatorum]